MNKSNKRDMGAVKNGILISVLSACVMLGAVGTYRLTSSKTVARNTDASQDTVQNTDTSPDTDALQSDQDAVNH